MVLVFILSTLHHIGLKFSLTTESTFFTFTNLYLRNMMSFPCLFSWEVQTVSLNTYFQINSTFLHISSTLNF